MVWFGCDLTYGLSVHVKTSEKPHDRTSDSASLRDLGLDDIAPISVKTVLQVYAFISQCCLSVIDDDVDG